MAALQSTKEPVSRAAWSVKEFCERLGISSSCFWKYHAQKKIRSIKIGNRLLITDAELQRVLAEGVR